MQHFVKVTVTIDGRNYDCFVGMFSGSKDAQDYVEQCKEKAQAKASWPISARGKVERLLPVDEKYEIPEYFMDKEEISPSEMIGFFLGYAAGRQSVESELSQLAKQNGH